MSVSFQSLLLSLLLQVGLMVALASLVSAIKPLREVVSGENKDPLWQIGRVVFEVVILVAGLRARISLGYESGDLSLEGVFLIGWVHGATTGIITGLILGIIHLQAGWPGAIPFLILVGVSGAGLANRYKMASSWMGGLRAWGEAPAGGLVVSAGALLSLKTAWIALSWVGVLQPVSAAQGAGSLMLVILTSGVSVAAPLWIWRGVRVETELERRTREMERVKMESLIARFRPHFLFNTLNAIVSLMRTDVEGARSMSLKLAGLLRRSLEEDVYGFVPLREELRFADDYLSIEGIRHGDRLRVKREIEPETMDFPVPRMILQPLVENAILHGIDPKVEGGILTLRAWKNGENLNIEVADNGVGLSEDRSEGVGLNNLRDRLRAAYGFSARLELRPGSDGEGARALIKLPPRRIT